MTAKPEKWRNRIVGQGSAKPTELTANPLNFRRHPELQKQAMAGVLDKIGWIQNVVVNKRSGRIIDGHLRVEIAIARKEATIPVMFVDLDENEERMALATLDPISGLAETDRDMLGRLLGQIEGTNPDMAGLMDILAKQAGGILDDARDGACDPDAAPAVNADPGKAICRPGDIWQLGPHRLAVGDCSDQALLKRLMGDEQADLVLTDPPYGVAYQGAAGEIANDEHQGAALHAFLQQAFKASMAVCRPGTALYVFHATRTELEFRRALEEAGWEVKQTLVWVKSSATLSRQDYNWRHEPIFYGWAPGAAHYFGFDYCETTVIDDSEPISKMPRDKLEALAKSLLAAVPTTVHYADKPKRNAIHPTMKPVELIARLMGNSSRKGELVLDPFGGSGSTMIAADRIGRKARLVELDVCYADVICRRWQQWSGQHATLDGQPFEAAA